MQENQTVLSAPTDAANLVALDVPCKSSLEISFGFPDTGSLTHFLAQTMFLNLFFVAPPCFQLFYAAFCIGVLSQVSCLAKPGYLPSQVSGQIIPACG